MAAYLGKGTKLQRKNPVGGAYEDIAQVRSIDGPSSSSDQVDVTTHSSVGGYREFIPGLKDGGELNFELIVDPADAGFTNVNADFEAQLNREWRVILSDAGTATIDFLGAVTSRALSIPTDGPITMSVTIKVSGAITITP